MNNDIKAPAPILSARRRLIGGVFGAPAALTLYSGSVLAATSGMQCVANQVAKPATPGPVAGPDTWVRVRLYTLGTDITKDKYSAWVKGSDISALKSSTSVSAYPTFKWQCFTAGSSGGNKSGYTVGQSLGSDPVRSNHQLTQSGPYVAVRVDAAGEIIGVVGINDGAGSAIAQTCWTSVVVRG